MQSKKIIKWKISIRIFNKTNNIPSRYPSVSKQTITRRGKNGFGKCVLISTFTFRKGFIQKQIIEIIYTN